MKNTCVIGLLALMAGTGSAQDSTSLDDAQRAAVVEDVAHKLIDGYIYAEVGEKLARHLTTRLEEGAYDSLTARERFAAQLSSDLYALSNDIHLKILPRRSASAGAPGGGQRRMVRNMTGAGAGDVRAAWPGMPDFRRVNHGFQELKILEGNVGYLDLRVFSPSPDALARVDAAMAFLDDVDALIIDVGRNRGGAGTIVTYFSAYFFAEPTHLLDRFQRGMEKPDQRWTDKQVAGRLRPDLPVFLLVSSGTGSAAESFTFGLSVADRVTLVGERTVGAGHFGDTMRPLAHGFEMFLPIGRVYDPATGKGFEAEGIAPDVEVPYAEALREAHLMAVDAGREFRVFMDEKDDASNGGR